MTDPSAIAGGPAFWLKADSLTGLSDTDPISTWTDSSTGAHDATGSLTARPLYRTGVINSLPIARFASNDKMTSAASTSGAEQTIIAVYKSASLAARNTIRAASSSGGLTLRTSSGTAGALELVKEATSVIGTGNTSVGTTDFHVLTATFSDSGNAYAFYIDGTATGSGTSATSLTAARTTILGQNSGGGDAANGDLAELLCWDSVLSTGDRAAAHSYLQDKYGITVSDYVSGSSNSDLVVADAAHAHAADNVALTQVHSIAVADATHAHAAENVVLTQVHTLVVADASHAVSSDEVDLTQEDAGSTNLVVADAHHAHSADSVALTQNHVLVVADASHAMTSDTVTFSVPVYLFTPPTVEESTPFWGGLSIRRTVGVSVLVTDGVYRQVRTPSQYECEAADAVYLGGHRHPIDEDTRASLIEAGYSAFITTVS